ncbi:MAG: tetratricopeptide repeat protein [Bacteroidales bacterium]|nr:tetratricopeptide repeat protein [Bacteroidales bacterium]MDD4234939.1 tetratricopeptide repeat protein [Bacteroidales bacterium]
MKFSLIKYLFVLGIAVLLFPQTVISQHYDSQLAAEYMRNKEYDKASILYEQLYEKFGYASYRNNYIRCLSELEDYKTAEKFLKKELRKNKTDPSLYVYLGNIYHLIGSTADAEKEFSNAIEMASDNRGQTINTANSFVMHRQFNYAEQMYISASEKQKVSFDYELANIYYYQRDYQKMIDKFLDLIIEQPDYLTNVQSRLVSISASFVDSDLNIIIENSIILRIQQKPQSSSLYELLIWQYSQTGQYKKALEQNYVLDKRLSEKGLRVLQYGHILKDNQEYDLALEAFEYVLQQGETSPHYQTASIDYLNTLFGKVVNTPNNSEEELLELESLLIETLSKVRATQSFSLIYALANIQAFYLNKTNEAEELLSKVIEENKLNTSEIAECKLLYGDILLINENPWDATIIYAQVEKANINNPYGHEARFRKAKLAYYTGQFQWAQAQLDVLKASTSKLIANDAFELSFLISENLNLDTTETAMKLFAKADLLTYKNDNEHALLALDSIIAQFPSNTLIDDVYFRKAQIYERQGNIDLALEMYKKVLNNYSWDILADNALYKIAKIYDFSLKDKEKAMEYYEKIIIDYPGSIFTVESRKRFRFLRGDSINQ